MSVPVATRHTAAEHQHQQRSDTHTIAPTPLRGTGPAASVYTVRAQYSRFSPFNHSTKEADTHTMGCSMDTVFGETFRRLFFLHFSLFLGMFSYLLAY